MTNEINKTDNDDDGFYSSAKEAEKAYKEDFDGIEVEFDQCDDCGTWEVGQPRCNCGNRRVYVDSDEIRPGRWFAFPAAN